ncbi:MAG: alpha/beta hydrolase [Acholeplasmataceae bacterium]|nr:alpha/beta hydrolase [Acholeplasmataceae bacterium]
MDKIGQAEKTIFINDGEKIIEGSLTVPEGANGIVVFAHGSGSSRYSIRNNYVAAVIRKHNLATFLLDLLTPEEDADYSKRFDIDLLAHRLSIATKWLQKQQDTKNLKIGYFGASTGAAAAIQSAAGNISTIKAIVSRGGRPDLAMPYLEKISAPTLFIVGGNDEIVIELNSEAYNNLKCDKKFEIVKGATHLFEEPGTLEQVAILAEQWFDKYLAS